MLLFILVINLVIKLNKSVFLRNRIYGTHDYVQKRKFYIFLLFFYNKHITRLKLKLLMKK